MKISNKILAMALVGAILFGIIPGSKAQQADITLLSQPLLDRSLHVTSIAALQDALYIKADTGLYRYIPGDEEAVLLMERSDTYSAAQEDTDYFDLLLSDADTLYALNNQKGTLRSIAADQNTVRFGELKQLDWSSFFVEEDEYSYTRTPENIILSDGSLFMLSSDDMGGLSAMRFALQPGEVQTYEDLKNIKKLTPYKDGKLLALLYDDQTSYDQQTGTQKPPDLAIFDPQTGTLEPIGPLMVGMEGYWATALSYDEQQDKLYFTDKNLIYYRLALGEPVACAFLPSDIGYTGTLPLTVLDNGRLAALTTTGIALREDNPATLNDVTALVIAGYSDSDMVNRISAQMPNVRIDTQSVQYYSNEELAQAMLSRSSDADIFVLNTRMHQVGSFLQKGYALALPADGEAAKATGVMYPMIRDLAIIDGKTLALPISIEFSVDMVREDLFQKMGLTIPEDFFALCDTLQAWADETRLAYPEYNFWMGYDNKSELYDMALNIYKNSLRSKNEDLRFDTELFRRMMARAEEMDTEAIDVEMDWVNSASIAAQEEFYSKQTLIDRGYYFTPDMVRQPLYRGATQKITLFAAEPGAQKNTAAYVSLLLINPFSKNPEAALRFVDLYAASLPGLTRVMLMPQFNEPVLNPYFEQEVAGMQEYVTFLQKQIADTQAKGEPVSELEAELQKYLEYVRDAENTTRYLLKKDDIGLVRKIIDMAHVPSALSRIEDQADVYTAFNQFKEGTLSIDQFIKEADNKLRLVRLENQ